MGATSACQPSRTFSGKGASTTFVAASKRANVEMMRLANPFNQITPGGLGTKWLAGAEFLGRNPELDRRAGGGMKFVHTVDWQLGKPFGRFEPEVCAALADARYDAVDAIGAAAANNGANMCLSPPIYSIERPGRSHDRPSDLADGALFMPLVLSKAIGS
jgi:hypothetical protein